MKKQNLNKILLVMKKNQLRLCCIFCFVFMTNISQAQIINYTLEIVRDIADGRYSPAALAEAARAQSEEAQTVETGPQAGNDVAFPGIVENNPSLDGPDAPSGMTEPDLLKLELLSSASALGTAAKSSCTALGDQDQSYELTKFAAGRFLSEMLARDKYVQEQMDNIQNSMDERMESEEGQDINYQLEGLALQMSSIQVMIDSYIGEEHGSISIRSRLSEVLEEAEVAAMEEFENFDRESLACEEQIINSQEVAQQGCNRTAIIETCDDSGCTREEVSDPVEGSCEAVEVIAGLPSILGEYRSHFVSVQSSLSHKEKYDEIVESFENVAFQVPAGEWKSGVESCNETVAELFKKTAIKCESVVLTQDGGEEDQMLSEMLSEEEMDMAKSTVIQADKELYESMTSSEAEIDYLQKLSLAKFKKYDQVIAQPANRTVPFEELRMQISQLNTADVMKAQKHFQDYQLVSQLYQQLAGMQEAEGEGEEDENEEENERQILQNGSLAGTSLNSADGLSGQALSDTQGSLSGQSQREDELSSQDLNTEDLQNQGFLAGGAIPEGASEMGIASLNGNTNARERLLTESSNNLGLSSALSRSEQARKKRLEAQTRSILDQLGGGAGTRRDQEVKRVNQDLISGTGRLTPGLALPSSLGSGSNIGALSSLGRDSLDFRSRASDKSSNFRRNDAFNRGPRSFRRNGVSSRRGASEKSNTSNSRSPASVSRSTSSLDSKSEVENIYSRYEGSSESYSSVLNEGQIHNKNSNIFDVISRRYIISGFKRLDNE